ncbi:MAG: hypothetical protein ABI597_03155 [Gammaproteobacteria bacterium]
MTKFTILFTCILLSACAATNPYIAPAPSQDNATIRGYKSGGVFNNFNVSRIMKIDDKDNADAYDFTKEISVMPGEHGFIIATVFNQSFWKNNNEAYSEVRAKLLPGHHYHIMEIVQNERVKIWVADQNGNTVSPVVSNPYKMVKDQTIVIFNR